MCQTIELDGRVIGTVRQAIEEFGIENLIAIPEVKIDDILRTLDSCLCGLDLDAMAKAMHYSVELGFDPACQIWRKPVLRFPRAG